MEVEQLVSLQVDQTHVWHSAPLHVRAQRWCSGAARDASSRYAALLQEVRWLASAHWPHWPRWVHFWTQRATALRGTVLEVQGRLRPSAATC